LIDPCAGNKNIYGTNTALADPHQTHGTQRGKKPTVADEEERRRIRVIVIETKLNATFRAIATL
jgi:hypothetical protein